MAGSMPSVYRPKCLCARSSMIVSTIGLIVSSVSRAISFQPAMNFSMTLTLDGKGTLCGSSRVMDLDLRESANAGVRRGAAVHLDVLSDTVKVHDFVTHTAGRGLFVSDLLDLTNKVDSR